MIPGIITSQTGGKQYNGRNMTNYSMFVGGTNATHHALMNYSPALNNFGRLFMVRPPYVLLKMFGGDNPGKMYSKDSLFIQFKHMMEYMNRKVTGFGEKKIDEASTPIKGGFAGRQFNTPTVTKETTNEVQIGLYEMEGMPVFTVIDGWMNAIGDENSGLATYGGYISGGTDSQGKSVRLYKKDGDNSSEGIEFNEANHTAEFIYVYHDRSGAQVNRAVMLADCYPKGINQAAALDYEGNGDHDNITYDITWNCVVYRSPIITAIGNDLLKQYRIVSNSLNFNPELGDAVYADNNASLFNKALGSIPVDSATGTNIGNIPVFDVSSAPKIRTIKNKDINDGKLAGQPGREAPENWDGFSEKYKTNISHG